MARTPGARNYNFGMKRGALIDSAIELALQGEISRPSLRQFAISAETSEPTLRHYFSDRKGLVIAIMEEIGERTRPLWQDLAAPAESVDEAVKACFHHALTRITDDQFVRMHAFGLIEGVADPSAGQAYLKFILEPSLDCIRQKLAATPGASGDAAELQTAALAIFSPVIMFCLHQHLLGGRIVAPLDGQTTVMQLSEWLAGAISESV